MDIRNMVLYASVGNNELLFLAETCGRVDKANCVN